MGKFFCIFLKCRYHPNCCSTTYEPLGLYVSVIDLDAIPLKDISPLFEKYSDSDIVGSHSFAKILGICFGFVLFRSTPRNGMSQTHSNQATYIIVYNEVRKLIFFICANISHCELFL